MSQSVGAVALDIVMGKNTVSGVAKQAIADVKKTFNDGSATISSKASAVGTACKQVGGALLPVSVAAQGVIKSTADAAMSFETAMAQVKTIAGDSAVSYKGNMTDMSKAILQLSKDTGVSADEIAGATYNAISAGVDVSKSVEFVATANALATGGFTDMTTSVDVLTTTLNAYGEKAGTAESISDKLITTQNLGKTTVNELASSMGTVIPTASAYGVSVDNLCASYVALTKGGIATAEATTYMKSMFNELADSGSTVGGILQEKTGMSFGQLMESGMSLADVIDILGQSVNGDAEAFAQLWGSSEAGTGALAILNGGTADFNNTLNEMGNSTGAASSAMDKMNDTSAHKMQVAMNNLKNASIELGASFTPVIEKISGGVSKVAQAFNKLSPQAKSAISTILMIVAVAAPVLVTVGTIVSGIGKVVSVIGVLKGAIGGLSISFNPVVLAIVGVIAVGALLIANWDKVKEVAGRVWNGIKDVVSNVCNGIKNVVSTVWNGIKSVITTVLNVIKTIVSTVWNGIKAVITTVLNIIKAYITTVFNIYKTIITTVINAIKAVITTVFNAIKAVITTVLNAIKAIITTVFNIYKTIITTVINAIKAVITTVFNAIKAVITTVVNTIKSVISNVWNAIKNVTSTVFNSVKSVVSSVWNGIKSVVTNAVNGAKNAATNAWNGIKNGITNASSNIKSAVTNCFNGARDTIKNFASQALGWGKDFVEGLANGIKNAAGKVVDAAKGLGNKIKSLLHFSRPDEGPLRDYETWMPDFVQGMANGIEQNKYKLIDSVQSMASQMIMPAIQAPELKNVGTGTSYVSNPSTSTSDDRLYVLLSQLVAGIQKMGDITVPVYLGNDLIDEQIVRANDRRTLRSGGRA